METAEARSRVMRAVKSKNTAPEILVRQILYSEGFRYRLHPSDLPGHPDIIFRNRKKAIFVHGCFWHGHTCPRGARSSKNNAEYWNEKVARNRKRDQQTLERMDALGWKPMVIWECELKDQEAITIRLKEFLA